MDAPLPVDPMLPKRRRNRTIQSCFHCRTRKLKCDRLKPACTTCVKLGNSCEYISTGTATDIQNVHAITEKIERLEKELALLKSKRNAVVRASKKGGSAQQEDQILLGHALSLFSPTRTDPFLNQLLEMYKNTSMRVPTKETKDELEAMRTPINRIDTIKFQLKKDHKRLSDLIKPHITDLNTVWYLVTRFFDSELYSSFYFFDKDEFITRLSTFSTPKESYGDDDYLFIGQVLIIMRITYLSFYNCGYNELEIRSLKPVDEEVFHLAKLCLEHVLPTMLEMSTPYIQLLALVTIYQTFAPDVHDWAMADLNKLIRLCYMAGYNLDQESDIHRKIWFVVMELDIMRFLYDGTPISIGFESYAAELPGECRNSFQRTVNAMIMERTSVHQLVQPISEQLNNAREPPTIRNYERQIDAVMEYLDACNLNVIMLMPPNTVEERLVKLHKLNNFLDLGSLCFMLCSHLLIHFFENSDIDNAARFSIKVITCLNALSPITYFLDAKSNHEFNLNYHFGLTFHLIPKINQILHHCYQIHFALLLRLVYLQSHDARANLQGAIALLISNTGVILTNYGKIGERFGFAKALYKFGSDVIVANIGSTSESQARHNLLGWLSVSKNLNFHPDFQYILPKDITDNLVTLKGEINIDHTPSSDILDLLLAHGLDPFSVQKIESLLLNTTK